MLTDFTEALQLGKIDVPSVEVAVDMGMDIGMATAMLRQTVLQGVDETLIEVQSMMVFRALGVPKRIASALREVPIPPLPETPLRVHVIHAGLD